MAAAGNHGWRVLVFDARGRQQPGPWRIAAPDSEVLVELDVITPKEAGICGGARCSWLSLRMDGELRWSIPVSETSHRLRAETIAADEASTDIP